MHKKLIALLLAVIMILAMPASVVFAAGGDGSGQGKNKNLPLKLEYSSVADGDEDVYLNETIELDFSKNICNVIVLADNKKCFHLTDVDGNAVAIKLIFPDDQVQHDYKRQVFIAPAEELEPLSDYKLSVDKTLKAKNGKTIDNAYVIEFTTGSETTEEIPEILSELGDYTISYESSLAETADSVPVNIEDLDEEDDQKSVDTGSIAMLIGGIIVVIIVAGTAAVVLVKRKKRKQ